MTFIGPTRSSRVFSHSGSALYAIDRHGIVRYAFLGSQQWQLGDIDEALAALAKST